MTNKFPTRVILISVVLSKVCTTITPSATVSETVIESVLPTKRPETHWRLDSAWQGGGLGGSALRGSSIEHVVRQVDNKLSISKSTAVSRSAALRPKPFPKKVLKPGCTPNSVLK